MFARRVKVRLQEPVAPADGLRRNFFLPGGSGAAIRL
jgi:hypothetical protein